MKWTIALIILISSFCTYGGNLKMKNGLSFDLIKDYKNYKIVATHYRTDKKELRYILANDIAYKALSAQNKKLPYGSKIVKIGWSTKESDLFPSSIEADKIQRIEYMSRSKKHKLESDGWGYARFVKEGNHYTSWKGDVQDCVSCHSIAAKQDFVFTHFQKIE